MVVMDVVRIMALSELAVVRESVEEVWSKLTLRYLLRCKARCRVLAGNPLLHEMQAFQNADVACKCNIVPSALNTFMLARV